jgi:hypothetical protein
MLDLLTTAASEGRLAGMMKRFDEDALQLLQRGGK